MEGQTTNMLTDIVSFFNDTVLPMSTALFQWIVNTDGIKYLFYIVVIGAIIGLAYRVKNFAR